MSKNQRVPRIKSILADFKNLLLGVKGKSLTSTKATEELGHIDKKIQAYGDDFGHKKTYLYTLVTFSKEARDIIKSELG